MPTGRLGRMSVDDVADREFAPRAKRVLQSVIWSVVACSVGRGCRCRSSPNLASSMLTRLTAPALRPEVVELWSASPSFASWPNCAAKSVVRSAVCRRLSAMKDDEQTGLIVGDCSPIIERRAQPHYDVGVS